MSTTPVVRPSDDLIAQALEIVADWANGYGDPADLWAVDVLRAAAVLPELMGAKEVCDFLGVASGNLRRNSGKTRGLPEPRQQLAATAVWIADEIRAFQVRQTERVDHGSEQREDAGSGG